MMNWSFLITEIFPSNCLFFWLHKVWSHKILNNILLVSLALSLFAKSAMLVIFTEVKRGLKRTANCVSWIGHQSFKGNSLSRHIYWRRNCLNYVQNAWATYLMQAFLSTCNEFYMDKTGYNYIQSLLFVPEWPHWPLYFKWVILY